LRRASVKYWSNAAAFLADESRKDAFADDGCSAIRTFAVRDWNKDACRKGHEVFAMFSNTMERAVACSDQ
jgi:hypothetical protein